MIRLIALACLLLTPFSVYSADIPAGLNPGDSYRILFTTQGRSNALSSDISDYNAFVNAEAERTGSIFRGLGIEWAALASASAATDTVDYRDNGYQGTNAVTNTGTSPSLTGVPIYNSRLELIAISYADFWDSEIDATPGYDQFESIYTGAVWTGTYGDGIDGTGVEALGGNAALIGRPGYLTNGWFMKDHLAQTNANYALYALSEVLIINTPIPAAAWLFGSALLGLGAIKRKRR